MSKCLLFDCDGTLVDSERLCNVAMARIFEEYGILLETDELIREFRGWKLSNIMETLQARYSISLAPDFIETYRFLVSTLFVSELRPIAHIETALESLPHPKAVVSSGPREKIELALKLCDLSRYFGANIYSSYEIGSWKPDPEIYRYAATDMGFDLKDCVVIEDGLICVEAGHRAGAATFFYNKYDELCEFKDVVSFKSMKDLPIILDTHNKSMQSDAAESRH